MKWILMQTALLVVTVTANKIMSLEDEQVTGKKPANIFSGLMESAMDGDNDATFDSVGFCASRLISRHNNTEKIFSSPLRFGLTTAGLMNCVVLVDTVLFPWNVYKQSSRDIKALSWKKADFRSLFRQLAGLSSTLMRSMAVSPFRTFVRLLGVVYGSIMTYANKDVH